jgi:hypothetical protein
VRTAANHGEGVDGGLLASPHILLERAPANFDAARIELELHSIVIVAESNQAKLWREKLAVAGVQDEHFVPGFPTRLLARLARRFSGGKPLPRGGWTKVL